MHVLATKKKSLLAESHSRREDAGGPGAGDQPQVLVNQALEDPTSVLAGGKKRA